MNFVRKRSGKLEEVNFEKIEKALKWATTGLSVDYKEIFNEESKHAFFYDEVPTDTIQSLLANTAETKIAENWDWSYCAARLVLQKVLKEAHGNAQYKTYTDYYTPLCVYLNRIQKEGLRKLQYDRIINHFDLNELDKAIAPERDLDIEFMGMTTLEDRYLLKNNEGFVIEAPQHFFMRVAMGLALAEPKETATQIAIEFYNEYSTMQVLSSTPTLFNSATTFPQLSSCFVAKIKDDSLEGIFETGSDVAKCSKFSGGTALDITGLRSKGSLIKSTGGKSSGIVRYEKLFEEVIRGFDQGGKRPGVIAIYLETWHQDLPDFLDSVNPSGDERLSVRDIQIANWIPDLFMKRVFAKETWTLFSPSECPDLNDLYGEAFEEAYLAYEQRDDINKKVVNALDLWHKMINVLFTFKGKGWPCFKDTANRRSMTRGYGMIHSSNLCTEITLRNGRPLELLNTPFKNEDDRTSVCNLASVNLSKVKTKEQLEKSVRLAVRMTDNAISESLVPIEAGKKFNDEDRPLGLGVMGYSEFLADQGISYNSYEHVYAADLLMEYISYIAIDESSKIGKEKGNFPMFERSQWAQGELPIDTGYNAELQGILDGIDYHHSFFENLKRDVDWESLRLRTSKFMRNSNIMAIAPTATISNIAGCTSCTELPQDTFYNKGNLSGTFTVVSQLYRKHNDTNPHLVLDAKTAGSFFSVLAAAARQKWIDQSQSLNIWVDSTVTGKQLKQIYEMGWRLGVKTFYYLKSEASESKSQEIVETSEETPVFCNMEEGCEVCQ